MPPIEVLVIAPLVILTAYVIFGVSGFGSTVIAVPLLAHLLPIKFVIPTVLLLDCVGAFGMGFKLRADVHRSEVVPLVPFLMIGLAAGAWLLVSLASDVLLTALAVFVLAYGVLYASGRHAVLRVPRWTAAPAGLFAGTTSSMFGVGGPIYVMYLAARGATPEQIRATLPVIFIITTTARIVLFTYVGLFTTEVLITAAALLPVMIFGVWLGHRLQLNMSREQLVRIVGGLLIASGGSLLVRALLA